MKNALLVAALVAAAVAPCSAQKPGPHDTEFRTFYASFLAAVRANDKERLADMIAFPVDAWSMDRSHEITTGHIKDRADFLARYDSLFTASMRSHIPRAKLDALPDGAYILFWRATDVEFSFEFDYVAGAGYRVHSYTIGPF